MGGGGIQGGTVIGASDERGAYVADRKVSMGDLYATIYKAMGIPTDMFTVFFAIPRMAGTSV